jgi:hypothetical protein
MPDVPLRPYLDRSRGLVSRYKPIVLSCEMNKYGLWVVVWSAAPGYRLAVTCARVGISRSEAVFESSTVLAMAPAGTGGAAQ